MLNLNLNILGASNKPIVPIAPDPTTTTTTTSTTTSTTTTTTLGPKFIPTNGLIQYLDTTELSSYPGSGSVWYDISGNGYNATTFSGTSFPTWDGTLEALNFNGSNNALTASFTGSITTNTQLVWAKLGTLSTSGTYNSMGLYNIQRPGGADRNWDNINYNSNSDNGWANMSSDNNRNVISNVEETDTNDFVCIAITRQSGEYEIFRNGVSIDTAVFSPPDRTDGSMVIGNAYYQLSNSFVTTGYFTGSLSMCLTYNRVLTNQEISDLYTQGR
jgi:hypothetical protein